MFQWFCKSNFYVSIKCIGKGKAIQLTSWLKRVVSLCLLLYVWIQMKSGDRCPSFKNISWKTQQKKLQESLHGRKQGSSVKSLRLQLYGMVKM